MTEELSAITWPEAARLAGSRTLVVPIGSTEQHGPHLPLGTDTMVVEALCQALAESNPAKVMLSPTISIGASDEHRGFAGTLSVGTEALAASLQALAASASGFGGILFATTHGGNLPAMKLARAALGDQGARCLWWWPGPVPPALAREGDLHAGWMETSIMLHLAPRLVPFSAPPRVKTRAVALRHLPSSACWAAKYPLPLWHRWGRFGLLVGPNPVVRRS